jgi:hypothetical protein
MMGIGKMGTKREWGAIFMEMEFIWVNATWVLDMGKESTFLRTDLATKETGSKAKERAGVFTSMRMEVNILASISLASEKVSACTNTIIKKPIKATGKKIKRMAMELQCWGLENFKLVSIETTCT